MNKEKYIIALYSLLATDDTALKIDSRNELEQLINEHFELKEKYNELADNTMDIIDEECLKKTRLFVKENERLKKALDKACDRLDFFDHLYGDDEYEDWKTKEQWKEWCLKDVD